MGNSGFPRRIPEREKWQMGNEADTDEIRSEEMVRGFEEQIRFRTCQRRRAADAGLRGARGCLHGAGLFPETA